MEETVGGSWGGVASGESGIGINIWFGCSRVFTIVTRDVWKKGFKEPER